MSGIGEASLVLGIISSIISIIETTKQVYDAIEDEAGLPKNFKKSATKLPLISQLLEDAERYINTATGDELIKAAFTPTLEDCEIQAIQLQAIQLQAIQLQELFEKVMPKGSDSRWDRYVKAARTIGKKGRVESLIGGILDDLQLLATRFPQVMTSRGKEKLENAIEEVAKMEPSLPDGFEQMPAYAHYGSGAQNNNTGGGTQNNNNSAGNQNNGPGQQFIGTNHITKNVTVDDINRSCLHDLQCPDTLAVKCRLKENKDKLLYQSIDWILQDPQYISWKCGGDVSLLWIKGGAGKGKTMISIGLIERLSFPQDESTVVTYFFFQNADYELNTLQAIIKGLILQLVNQQKELIEYLRDHWDTRKERFNKEMTSWRTLWDIFYKMLYRCKCPKIYVIVDALDECQDDGMTDLLKLVVRTGLDHPSKIKWLLTSRPLDSAEQELLVGCEQVMISLELNSTHISQGVTTYIVNKVAELDRRNSYGSDLCQKIQNELTEKAEDAYLWVSLICKRLESVHRENTLTTIQDLPPGLHLYYNRVLHELSKGQPAVVKGCMRLLRVMMLVYRPLNVVEVDSVLGLSKYDTARALDRCASFLKVRGTDIKFVHQSARDYLAGENGRSILDTSELYGHNDIAVSCLSYLSQTLKTNLVDLPRPDSTRKSIEGNQLMTSLDYAATFWAQHLEGAREEIPLQDSSIEQAVVGTFLRSMFLEWLECLSLLDKLSRATEALKILKDIADLEKNVSLSMLVQDVTHFLSQHYRTIENWPLQIYNSAIAFSPETSIIRKSNLSKLPVWLRKLPQAEDSWASSIRTLTGYSDSIIAIAFSPDSKQIASGSDDKTIKLWDAITGNLRKIFTGHSHWVTAIAFSPDGQSDWVTAIAFSSGGKRIASGSFHGIIKLWDAITGDLEKIITGHSHCVTAIAFSPGGKQIVSGSDDKTIKLWNIAKFLKVSRMFGSRVGRRIDFCKWQEIKTSQIVEFVRFSTDGRHLVTDIGSIKIKNIIDMQSPDCDQVAIGVANGQIWNFDIDRTSLNPILKSSM
ncbi:uncharacterized protein EAF02_001216 [Botrytis sinoallii]|uniref:uncharacterized protein n=1 Tax=Botrytis sinoallii TaxID=1463999 RepID=UPI0018FF1298|nr:uncharacterized protein EAF02_001216 [Botrytis sinoallii]KAF7893678.1 hypothetical protein EAF02_001216 [Botrytis sinoallii]